MTRDPDPQCFADRQNQQTVEYEEQAKMVGTAMTRGRCEPECANREFDQAEQDQIGPDGAGPLTIEREGENRDDQERGASAQGSGASVEQVGRCRHECRDDHGEPRV